MGVLRFLAVLDQRAQALGQIDHVPLHLVHLGVQRVLHSLYHRLDLLKYVVYARFNPLKNAVFERLLYLLKLTLDSLLNAAHIDLLLQLLLLLNKILLLF